MVRRRWLLIGTIGWVIAYLAAYLVVLNRQGDSSPAWWYVALLVVAVGMLGLVATGRLGRRGLVAATVMLGVATVLGLLSIGVFLIPALVAAVLAASMPDEPSVTMGRTANG